VCAEGLQVLAGQCAAHASRLTSQVPAAAAGPPAQATAAAVSIAYTALGSTAAVLAAKVEATGDELTVSATRYSTTDDDSAQQLSGLGGPVQV
jgi:hypothetical protein